MVPTLRAWAVLGAGGAGALLAWVLLEPPWRDTLALGLAAGGLMASLVLLPSGVPPDAFRALVGGGAASAAHLAEAVALAGPPLVVPAGGNLPREVLFLPTSSAPAPLPSFDASTRLYAAPPGHRHGVAVEPPGLALVLEAEEATGQRLAGASRGEVEDFLRALGGRTGLWSRLSVEPSGEPHVRFAPSGLLPCATPEGRAACERGFCPACSAFAVALARSLRKPVEWAWVREEEGLVRVALREAAA